MTPLSDEDMLPRRLWIIKEDGSLRYQVCKNNEEMSVPYMSVAEHKMLVARYLEALERISSNVIGESWAGKEARKALHGEEAEWILSVSSQGLEVLSLDSEERDLR